MFTPTGVWQYAQPLRKTQIKPTSGRTTIGPCHHVLISNHVLHFGLPLKTNEHLVKEFYQTIDEQPIVHSKNTYSTKNKHYKQSQID
jgi:hypothetical protein